MSQSQLAGHLGVTFAALNRWVNGHARPRPSKIAAIEKLYKEVAGFPSLTEKDLLASIKETNRLRRKKLWDQIASNKALQDDLLLDHTYNSTSIEGTTFTKKEAEAVIFDKAVIPEKSLIEHLEVTNHAVVLRRLLKKDLAGPITESLIKEIHKELLNGIREDAGIYSKTQRGIRGVDIALTHPEDIPEEMGNLIRHWKGRPAHKTIKEMADFHVTFELIHPFGDGNGRVGRLLMVMQCLEAGYPPVVIETARKSEYYEVLEYAQRKSDIPFVLFLADEMKKTEKVIRKYI